jgi:hypothetical protein
VDRGAAGGLAWPCGALVMPVHRSSSGGVSGAARLRVSKLVVYRAKDFAFAAAMLESGLIDPTILAGRIARLPASLDPLVQKRLHSWLKAWVDRHQPA